MIFEGFLSVRRLLTTKNTNTLALNSNPGAALSSTTTAVGRVNNTTFLP
jgi:hypothetical protein